MTGLSIIPEWSDWLAGQRARYGAIEQAAQLWNADDAKPERTRTSPPWTREVAFTDAEWRFLWRRFQPVGTAPFGFARRLQCAISDVMALSPEQRCWALALAYKYRRKVFFNPAAGRLTEAAFCAGIRKLAGKGNP